MMGGTTEKSPTAHRFWVNVWAHAIGGGTYATKEDAHRNGQGADLSVEIELTVPPAGLPGVRVRTYVTWKSISSVFTGIERAVKDRESGDRLVTDTPAPRHPVSKPRCNVRDELGGLVSCTTCGMTWDKSLGVTGCTGGDGVVPRRKPQDELNSIMSGGTKPEDDGWISARTRKLVLRELLEPLARGMRQAEQLVPPSHSGQHYELVGTDLALVNLVLAEYLGPPKPSRDTTPCPICGGVEGCDHTVLERRRAAMGLHRDIIDNAGPTKAWEPIGNQLHVEESNP